MQLARWLLSKPENLTKRILTSLKILRNLQRSLIVTLGIRGPGGAPGDPSQAILPHFIGAVGGEEDLDWFAVDSTHACEVMGFLMPHMHVARSKPHLMSPPVATHLHHPFQPSPSTASSPNSTDLQPHTPDRGTPPDRMAEDRQLGGESLTRRLSQTHTPSGLAVIPEDEKACLQSFGEDETSPADSEQLDDYVERTDSGDDDEAPPSPRHIYSTSDAGGSTSDAAASEHQSHSVVSGERSQTALTEEVSENSYFHAAGDLDRVETGDSAPPELAEEEGKLAFEDSDQALSANFDGQYTDGQYMERSRSSGSAVSRGTADWRHNLGGWDYGADSASDDLDNADLWDCHRSKLEELEDALQRIRM